jgi:hypothetical protein
MHGNEYYVIAVGCFGCFGDSSDWWWRSVSVLGHVRLRLPVQHFLHMEYVLGTDGTSRLAGGRVSTINEGLMFHASSKKKLVVSK